MFKTFDMVLIGVMVAAAAFTYQTKHQTEDMMREIRKVEQQVRFEEETIDLLNADWALLTQPSRMQTMAEAFNHATPVATETITETALFPKAGLDPQSITLIPADAFGFEKFDRVFVAEYHLNGSTLSAFVSARGSPEATTDLAAAYRAFLLTFGGKALDDGGIRGAVIVEIMDEYDIIFTRDVFIAGVHAAADKNRAVALARSLDTSIEGAIRGRP